jgi:hypothetical protein
MTPMTNPFAFISLLCLVTLDFFSPFALRADEPSRIETIQPIHNESFDKGGSCRTRRQGGNPRLENGILLFDGSTDGDRQVDPQIAVGGGHVLHATNSGIIIYDKNGQFINGVHQNCFNGGIDPKLFYDSHNHVFGFDLWNPWDAEKQKPVNISVSQSDDPTKAWNTYPVPAPEGRDGGAIGYSKQWIGYSFPGGPEQTFVLKTVQARTGQPITVYHFKGNLGHPVFGQDDNDEIYFFKITNDKFIVTSVSQTDDGSPVSKVVGSKKHNLEFVGFPPQSPQKQTQQKTASGDRNPKNVVLQNGSLWFSHTVNCNGRAAVQWHQVKLDGSIVQTGLVSDSKSSFIQTTIAVNKRSDVLVGFQETGPDSFISPRCAFRYADDPPGQLRTTISLGEGQGATNGVAWGDYSGSMVDGDNQLDLWTIQSITDKEGKGDTVIAKLPADLIAEKK